eukprot:23340-Eustigmatos_ZCMA.PRE.1
MYIGLNGSKRTPSSASKLSSVRHLEALFSQMQPHSGHPQFVRALWKGVSSHEAHMKNQAVRQRRTAPSESINSWGLEYKARRSQDECNVRRPQ